MEWLTRKKRRYLNYQDEAIQKPAFKGFNLTKMSKLLLKGSYEDFSRYAREFQMGEDFIKNTWSIYRGGAT